MKNKNGDRIFEKINVKHFNRFNQIVQTLKNTSQINEMEPEIFNDCLNDSSKKAKSEKEKRKNKKEN